MGDSLAFWENLDAIEGQTARVHFLMKGGKWWRKSDLAIAAKGSAHAMAARMSELRQAGAIIEKRHIKGSGVYEYRMAGYGPLWTGAT